MAKFLDPFFDLPTGSYPPSPKPPPLDHLIRHAQEQERREAAFERERRERVEDEVRAHISNCIEMDEYNARLAKRNGEPIPPMVDQRPGIGTIRLTRLGTYDTRRPSY